jgi:uncharacterized protein YbbC (DUF1343 family)
MRFPGLVSAAAVLLAAAVASAGVNMQHLGRADDLIQRAIDDKQLPGAVLLVGQNDQIVYHKAYGNRAVEPETVRMTTDTIFDAASLSKPVGTATSIMILADRGKLNLYDPVARYIPEFGINGKENVTVEQLLLHRSGLPAGNPMSEYDDGPEAALKRIYDRAPQAEPGTSFIYTDLGYIVLGELVKRVDGQPLSEFAHGEIFRPLGMNDTAYLPSAEWKPRIAPTEQRDGEWIIGDVHDPRAWALGGFAGHAGVFTTAQDLAIYCRMILNGGQVNGTRILSEAAVRQMLEPRPLPDGTAWRSYGWDVQTGFSSARGNRFESGRTFGHTGWTGTSMWLDPASKSYVILMSNRVHPNGRGNVIGLRRAIATVAAEALLGQVQIDPMKVAPERRPAEGKPAEVLNGIDILKRDNFQILEGQRVAVITNHTGRTRDREHLIDLLHEAENVNLVKIFSPEHGLYGVLDTRVGHSVHEPTGLRVWSLYGETRRPSEEMLEGVDTLVFDIQDIGARFYTYIATMGFAMEEAAKHGIRVVVLDRPNPITGLIVDGPIANERHFGFTAYGPLPVSHGMTVGELARMFNAEYDINVDLHVIEMEGWDRKMWFDETSQIWVNPSPNMRNLTQALLYLPVALMEASNISVGRGTDQPFELFGAPWIDGPKLAAALNGANLPGLRFVPIEFTPTERQHAGTLCQGVYIIVTDRNAVQPVLSGLTMAWHLKDLFGDAFDIARVVNLLQNPDMLEELKRTDDPCKLPPMWQEPLQQFMEKRAEYLIYD